MLFALALQAARPSRSNGGVKVHQVIVVPAGEVAYARTISPVNPRRQWRQAEFSLDEHVWAYPSIRSVLADTRWESLFANDERWSITTDSPVLFEITDAEYVEMKRGEMPRNVALRYQRAIDTKKATLVGAHARDLFEVRSDLANAIAKGDTTLGKAPAGDGTVQARLTNVLTHLDDAIRKDKSAMLSQYVPSEARAKGAGEHRNHGNLPTVTDAPAAAPVAGGPVVVVAEPVALGEKVKPGTVLVRPNGKPHVARAVDTDVKDMSDVDLLRTIHAAGDSAMLYGPPGTGKTAVLEVSHPGLRTMVLHPEFEATDLMGQWIPVVNEEGREELVWTDSEFVKAMEEGTVVLLDEIGLAPANQLAPLFSVLDGRRELHITANPARGTVTAREGFGVVAAFNPDTSRNISEALISRMVMIEYTSDYDVVRGMGVSPRMVDAAEHMDKQRENGEMSWSPQTRELLRFHADEAMIGTLFALRSLIGQAPETERDLVESHLRERFGDMPGAARKIRRMRV